MDPNVKAMVYHIGGRFWDYAFERLTTGRGNPVERRIEQLNKIIESLPAESEELAENPTSGPVVQEKPPERQSGGLSTEETVAYENREIAKNLVQLEKHYAQRLRILGIPCDCGSGRHLLAIEGGCENAIPMVANPQVYYRILNWVKEVGPKSTDEAAKSGLYDEEYPRFSHQSRDFRKEIIGSLDPRALFPQKPEMTLEEAKAVAAEEAAKQIERRWESQETGAAAIKDLEADISRLATAEDLSPRRS